MRAFSYIFITFCINCFFYLYTRNQSGTGLDKHPSTLVRVIIIKVLTPRFREVVFPGNKALYTFTDLTKHRTKMKTVVLQIEDSSVENFKALIHLCPSIEIVEEYSELEVRKDFDICMTEATKTLRDNKVLRKPSDYAYIMQVINEKQIAYAPYFLTPDAFLDYLKDLGFKNIPGRTTIYDTKNGIKGEYPKWTFPFLHADDIETLRRNNVARQFLSAYFKAQRRLSDRISDNG